MEKIKLSQTVIVEGKYDKIRLSNIIDANIIELGGFRIFKNHERLEFIRKLADRTGIIIMTDSDVAGFKLRHYLTSAIDNSKIVNVFIPEIHGKEKRKAKPGKEFLIGVEGMNSDIISKALKNAGIDDNGTSEEHLPITKAELYEMGLTGKNDSAIKRQNLCKKLNLPFKISANTLCEILPLIISEEELKSLLKNL